VQVRDAATGRAKKGCQANWLIYETSGNSIGEEREIRMKMIQKAIKTASGADAIGSLLYDALFALYFDGVV
jgi:hypothetical protein